MKPVTLIDILGRSESTKNVEKRCTKLTYNGQKYKTMFKSIGNSNL